MKINPFPCALKAGANESACKVSNIDQAIITSNVHMEQITTNELLIVSPKRISIRSCALHPVRTHYRVWLMRCTESLCSNKKEP